MLMLIFSVGDNLYTLDTAHVVEVIPRVNLRQLHQIPEYVAGLFNYRGAIVPVIDLCQLIQNHPSLSCLSTRIITVNYVEKENTKRWLGLMADG